MEKPRIVRTHAEDGQPRGLNRRNRCLPTRSSQSQADFRLLCGQREVMLLGRWTENQSYTTSASLRLIFSIGGCYRKQEPDLLSNVRTAPSSTSGSVFQTLARS
jgi:hypothetical protein